ncbi:MULTISPECIES: hypothetical protein [Amycolatopsis]|uniref:Uncharacterized protein n=2 Tax=Amycolatopsis TaxID=1813 RepID=A0ABV5U383_9PSEU|nr:hypothetical protein [Amycolatopsis bullii]GHG08766.1 hypothetical protein GCM10017567_26880 [Amycolatopsis bullii]
MSQPHDEAGEVDSSGNPVGEPPRREEPDGPLEDEDAKARPGHPATQENFRGGD